MPYIKHNDLKNKLHLISPTQKNIPQNNHKIKAKYSKPYYAKHYLNLDVPEHQYNWYQNIGKYHREIYLSPRDHGKTTAIPRVITEHETLYNPGTNVLLLSKTYNQAMKTLNMIETDLKKNTSSNLISKVNYKIIIAKATNSTTTSKTMFEETPPLKQPASSVTSPAVTFTESSWMISLMMKTHEQTTADKK